MKVDLSSIEFDGTLMDYFEQDSKVEKLIKILRAIDNSNTITQTDDNIIYGIYGDDEEIAMVYGLAEELLITDNGQCNWLNIKKLRDNGYRVFAGDEDNIGWLTGCIETKRGILVYG